MNPSPVALVIPVLDEEKALPALVEVLRQLDPQPAEIVVVDGGSSDRSPEIARAAGWTLVETEAGRGWQINAGVAAATAPLVCVLHADSVPPRDMVQVIRETLAEPRIALASFTPLIRGDKTRWGTTVHNWLKTWYAPLITRPHLFLRGVRLLFGDHGMFFRRAQFLTIGGCTPGDAVMEEADLCVKFAALGKIRMVPRWIVTSDRRIAAWGPLKANWIYFKVGILWAVGARARLARHYPHVR
ncbi:glycosyltransferase [Altererythrobacter sp. H2]|uniref:glycosyltransferase n=1 Tax=Altererythrobacter sp. H2 TaxID=3108391 RepID=UPI000BD18529|nr:glycosyltransferase [Altererythrobacter sp. H2]OZA93895.1 MAG: glycosyltransferase [Erythrobacter sp. 34-65-8]WRK96396.1 glycosyltransferase [Altererythrobacter sp. H2]